MSDDNIIEIPGGNNGQEQKEDDTPKERSLTITQSLENGSINVSGKQIGDGEVFDLATCLLLLEAGKDMVKQHNMQVGIKNAGNIVKPRPNFHQTLKNGFKKR